MNLYLDTSALVKLYVDEEGSQAARLRVSRARGVATSAIAYVEARAAFARKRRQRGLLPAAHRRIVRAFDADWERYMRLEVTDSLIRDAALLAEAHRLRAYDAIHLASATVLRSRLAEPVLFLSWDEDLESAAQREGLVSRIRTAD